MELVNIFTYIFIFLGTVINIVFGYLFKVDFEKIVIINIILTSVFLLLNIILKFLLTEKRSKAKSKNKGSFQLEIPPISDEELRELNKESFSEDDSFREVNPASLYNKGINEK
ncbi:MAG: hypothetical protein M0P77_01240 [Firmicutes bacterium]|nr:hypothetical protein [Bacillota bacterium]